MNTLRKQAILIMCHEDFYILEKTLELLDNENIDFYIHVDLKVKYFDHYKISQIPKKSHVYFTKRVNVIWGSYSQIETELLLLKTAIKNKDYQYYHLISGIDLPIKTSDELVNYFNNNYPTEFIGFKNFNYIEPYLINRVKYFHFITNNFKNNYNEWNEHNKYIELQKNLEINRLNHKNMIIRKGANWFSITDNLAKYVISMEETIEDIFSYGLCADELFLQSIVYNSQFLNNVCTKYNNEHENCKRLIDWDRGQPYTFTKDDYNLLMSSNAMFARKFSTSIDKDIIDMIYNHIKNGT